MSQMDPRKQWETSKKMYDFKVVTAKDADGPRVYVLEGLSKTGGATNQPVAAKTGKMRVAIGQDDGFIHRMEIYDKSLTNLVTSMEFKNLKFNADIPDSKFVYQPPADAHVNDVTAMFEMRMHARDADGEPATSESAPSRSAPAAPKTP
jgi:outer membrane lipoprotein-sorting protein